VLSSHIVTVIFNQLNIKKSNKKDNFEENHKKTKTKTKLCGETL
jgi:hypothetical protein